MDGWKVLERAKSKRQTKPRVKEISEAERLFQCGPVTRISPHAIFNTLLSFLKSEPLNWLSVPYCVPSLASAEGQDKFSKLAPTMVRVMESEIFYRGGLKGRHLHGDHYESYPIRDLDQFIYRLSYLLNIYAIKIKPGWPSTYQAHYLSEAVRNLEMYATGVRLYKGRRAAQPFKTVLSNLKTCEKQILAKPDKPRSASKSAIKKEITDIFCEHIQAPGTIIADQVSELLTLFGVETTPSSILKKLPRKKHTS
jgi:hypothetical protein